ncbi:MAG TPA: hypothetical protein VN764_00515 [Polyangiaceae bacterium]|nr:hypothetical protein [Polyangiaceae bacterium]
MLSLRRSLSSSVPLVLAFGAAVFGCSEGANPHPSPGSGGSVSSGGAELGAGGTLTGTGGTTNTGGDAAAGGSGSGGEITTGAGGTDAAGGSDGSGGTNTLPEEAILFKEDFEGATNDTVPAGWNSFVGYVVDSNNTPGGTQFALADSSKAHGGTRALHVKGGQQPAMLTRPLPEGTNRLYMRAHIWLTNKMGAIAEGNNHETLLGIRATPGDANNEVRFGQIKGVLGTNEVPSDDISPTLDSWGKGPEIAAGTWNCIEVAFLGDGTNHEVHAWNNGTEVHVVNDPSQWNNKKLGPTFLDGKFKEFIIGWHSFSNYDNEIWVDDIVVAKERVGCP